MAGGEFNGDGEEGEGHIYSAKSQNAWLTTEFVDSPSSVIVNRSVLAHVTVSGKGLLSLTGSKDV